MNRRNVKSKKIEFEPKIDGNKELIDTNSTDIKVAPKMNIMDQGGTMEGPHCPKTYSNAKKFDPYSHSFILNVPFSLENSVLVIFEDGTLGIRKNNQIYDCVASFIGDGVIVEVDEKVKKLGICDFIVTGYCPDI